MGGIHTGRTRDWISLTTVLLAVHILALLHHPSRPVSTIIIEQYRPPVEATVVGAFSLATQRGEGREGS